MGYHGSVARGQLDVPGLGPLSRPARVRLPYVDAALLLVSTKSSVLGRLSDHPAGGDAGVDSVSRRKRCRYLGYVGTVFQPARYTWLGLHENTYLIAALLLAGIIITYYTKNSILPLLRQRLLPAVIGEGMAFTVLIGLVFIFLRPIKQFIYFQF